MENPWVFPRKVIYRWINCRTIFDHFSMFFWVQRLSSAVTAPIELQMTPGGTSKEVLKVVLKPI